MKLIVTRFLTLETSYVSEVRYDGQHVCYALERLVTDRGIPDGVYGIEITMSPRFGERLPWINVPGRDGMRFHSGNLITQSLGCVLTGRYITIYQKSAITIKSRDALVVLMNEIEKNRIRQCEFKTL